LGVRLSSWRTASLRAAFWRSLTPTPRLSTRNSRAPSTTGKCPRPLACWTACS
jgi:Protein of unknown function (DUF2001).